MCIRSAVGVLFLPCRCFAEACEHGGLAEPAGSWLELGEESGKLMEIIRKRKAASLRSVTYCSLLVLSL